MHTNGYEAQSDEGCSSVSRSTPNGRQSIGDPLSDRWRIHEMYAAQYRQETEKGIPRLGYLPLSQEPLRISNSNHLSDEWRPSTNRSESSRAGTELPHGKGSFNYTTQQAPAPCVVPSNEIPSHIQGGSQYAVPQQGVGDENSGIWNNSTRMGYDTQSSHSGQNTRNLPNLNSPWTMRQPGMPTVGPSASGNVPTRLPSTRVSGSQQPETGTPSSTVVGAGRNGLLAADAETLFTHGMPVKLTSNNHSPRSGPSSEEPTLDPTLFKSPFGGQYQLFSEPVLSPQPKDRNPSSFPKYSTNSGLGNLTLQFAHFTPAPTPVIRSTLGEGMFSQIDSQVLNDSNNDPTVTHKLTKISSIHAPEDVTTLGAAADRAQNYKSSTKPESSNLLRQGKLFDQSTFATPKESFGPPFMQQPRMISATPYAGHSSSDMDPFCPTEDPFIGNYFDSHRNLKDFADPWSPLSPIDGRKLLNPKVPSKSTIVNRIERNEHWNDLIETSVGHSQVRRPVSPYMPPLNGIDHYNGSPQQPSRTRNLASSRSQWHKHVYSSPNQRCGSCYAVKLELENTRQQLLECMKERDQYHRIYFQTQRRLQEFEVLNQRLTERLQYRSSPPASKRSAESPITGDTATRLQQFHQQWLQCLDTQFQRGLLEDPSKDDQYFKSEFEMFFRSLKCWADRYWKFPNSEKIPRELEVSLKEVCGRGDYVESLIGNDKTKAFVVQGLISRFIVWDVLDPDFLRNLHCHDDENEMGKWCDKICKRIHDLTSTLISRVHDAGSVDASYRGLQGIIQHAARLSIAMAKAGGERSWMIDFPRIHEQFKADLMEDAEQFYRGVDASTLETDQALIKMVAMPLVVRIQQRKQPSIIYKAKVLLQPFSN